MFEIYVSTAPAYLPMAITLLGLGLVMAALAWLISQANDERLALVRLDLEEYEAPESEIELVNLELGEATFKPAVRRFDMNLRPIDIGLVRPIRPDENQPTA